MLPNMKPTVQRHILIGIIEIVAILVFVCTPVKASTRVSSQTTTQTTAQTTTDLRPNTMESHTRVEPKSQTSSTPEQLSDVEAIAYRQIVQDINQAVTESNAFESEVQKAHPGYRFNFKTQILEKFPESKPLLPQPQPQSQPPKKRDDLMPANPGSKQPPKPATPAPATTTTKTGTTNTTDTTDTPTKP